MTEVFHRFAHVIAHELGTPRAFVGFWLLVGGWFIIGWFMGWTEAWLIAFTLFLSIMTQASAQLIRYAEEHNSLAQQAKLDEIIHALPKARNEMIAMEERTVDEVERLREECQDG